MASRLLLVTLLISVSLSQIKGHSLSNALQSACEFTYDPKSCQSSLTQVPESLGTGPKDLGKIALMISIAKAKIVRAFIPRPSRSRRPLVDSKQSQAIEDCRQLYDLTLDLLTESLAKLTTSSVDYVSTIAVVGNGFLARDITFQNTAGTARHQPVALRVNSDRSAFYRCSFKGYQDTLYTHSLRQFYRECDVYGTVDFIFGNAAVVLQNCNLLARRPMEKQKILDTPMEKQKILYTAQGRTDPNQNTGTSILNCNVTAALDLAPLIDSFPTYLGRPWKKCSRTAYMQSYLDNLIQPTGWLKWSGNFDLSTLYYGEYENEGPGAETGKRVRWPGYHAVMNTSDALNFTVLSFIGGNTWLPSSGVPYNAELA